MDSAQLVLIISLVFTGAALLSSLYLLVQAIIDSSVLKKSGKNGPLKALGTTATIQETLRFIKLILLGSLLMMAVLVPDGSWVLMRRILIVGTVVLIAAGSLYGGHARRSLIRMVDEELERYKPVN